MHELQCSEYDYHSGLTTSKHVYKLIFCILAVDSYCFTIYQLFVYVAYLLIHVEPIF